MKKILLVSNASWSMVKFRYGLMKSLVENNYKVYVVSPIDEYSKEIEEIGCEYIDIKIDNNGSNPFNDLKLVYDLYEIYKKIKPNLIIHYTIKPNIYGSFATMLSGCKSISIIPGLGYTFINENFTSKIAKVLYKIALKIPEQVWFINKDDIDEFINRKLIDKSKIELINGEGVNIDKFKSFNANKQTDKLVFLMIARVLKDKGIYEYIEAIKIVKLKYSNIEFWLMGQASNNPTAVREDEINSWVNLKYINYFGSVANVVDYINKSDCVVLPSYREGLSMSLMESASMSKPIITSNITGCKEVVDDRVNGYLCEVKNAIDLASKIEMMINLSQDERLAMGRAGREKIIREFDERIVIEKYLKTIKEILK
ncbi:MAG: glycosyltransferase family 4 protein [Campylobacterota bacterium]|nr:glycosyltransferase family 4 protein [Campylobacterota bacterium]